MLPNGILAAAITPRRGLSVDIPAAIDLVHFLAAKGVAGVVLFGSTGEFPHFDLAARTEAAREIIKHARVPILVNASHSTLEGTVELARRALADGAATAVAMPPYYFRYTQPQLRDFFLRFGDSVEGPLSLYNIPIFTNELARETAAELLATGRFGALKDSSGDDSYLEFLMGGGKGAQFYVGNDPSYRSLKAKGVNGAISGIASAAPEVLVAIDSGNAARIAAAERLLHQFLGWFTRFAIPVAISQTLELRCGFPCPPAAPPDAALLTQFRGWAKEWIQEVEALCKI